MLQQMVYLIPACICALITVSLILLFRSELRGILRDFCGSVLVHACIGREVIRDFGTRRRNRVETVSWPGGVAVVTGARGIGFEVIKKLLQSDMLVIIGCRDLTVGERTVSQIRASGVTSGSAKVYRLDLASLASVKTFADQVLQCHPQLHILVNNAGASLKSHSLTEDGFERTFCTNYLGHCYLTHLLLSRLAETARTSGVAARVVNVASVAHRFPFLGKIHFEDLTLSEGYEEYAAYSQSKLAQVMFTASLSARLRQHQVAVRVFAVHPGIAYTGIVSQSIAHRLGGCLFAVVLRNAEQGARSVYYACVSSDLESRGGAYIYSCKETPTGKSAQSEESQERLWKIMMDKLGLKVFGEILP